MATPEEFAAECKAAARNLRRVPRELRRDISAQSREKVAEPLARKIAAQATGPYNYPLRAGTKARASADPKIVVGGMSPKLSGGAGPRDLIFGTEFGGGSRIGQVKGTPRRRAHRRHTTRQFAKNKRPFVYPTIAKNMDWVLEQFADIAITTVDKAVNDGN